MVHSCFVKRLANAY